MRTICFLSLALLAGGCADTAEDYEVNKPVITEPAPDVPAAQPEDVDVDLDSDFDVDNDATDDTSDSTSATPSSTPGAAGSSSSTSGVIENDAASGESTTTPPATP